MRTQPVGPRLPAHLEREIAVAAKCSPTTVRRLVAGLPVQQLSEARILPVLQAKGINLKRLETEAVRASQFEALAATKVGVAS